MRGPPAWGGPNGAAALTFCCSRTDARYLTEGVLTEQYVLEHVPPLLHALRKCNTTVRWLLLHRLTRHRKLAQMVGQGPPAGRVVRALVRTSQLEFQIKRHMERLLEKRQERWEAAQKETAGMMGELADFFGGGRALTRVEKDEDLQVRSWRGGREAASCDAVHGCGTSPLPLSRRRGSAA